MPGRAVNPPRIYPGDTRVHADAGQGATARHEAIGKQAYLDMVGPSTDIDRAPGGAAAYNEAVAKRSDDRPPRQ